MIDEAMRLAMKVSGALDAPAVLIHVTPVRLRYLTPKSPLGGTPCATAPQGESNSLKLDADSAPSEARLSSDAVLHSECVREIPVWCSECVRGNFCLFRVISCPVMVSESRPSSGSR